MYPIDSLMNERPCADPSTPVIAYAHRPISVAAAPRPSFRIGRTAFAKSRIGCAASAQKLADTCFCNASNFGPRSFNTSPASANAIPSTATPAAAAAYIPGSNNPTDTIDPRPATTPISPDVADNAAPARDATPAPANASTGTARSRFVVIRAKCEPMSAMTRPPDRNPSASTGEDCFTEPIPFLKASA